VSYVLSKALETKLTKLLPDVDKGVVRIFVEVGPNSLGEDWLYFRVVLKDDPMLATSSAALGKRLQKIATALRDRAARLNVPMFASVGFIAESELPRQKRKTA
jgi:hypothetical protein